MLYVELARLVCLTVDAQLAAGRNEQNIADGFEEDRQTVI